MASSKKQALKILQRQFDDNATSDVSTAENGIFVNSITRVGGLPSVNEVDISLNCALTICVLVIN